MLGILAIIFCLFYPVIDAFVKCSSYNLKNRKWKITISVLIFQLLVSSFLFVLFSVIFYLLGFQSKIAELNIFAIFIFPVLIITPGIILKTVLISKASKDYLKSEESLNKK
jgi:small-conductance mechanosensitive channel